MAKSKGRRLAEWLRNLDSNSKASSDTIADDSISTAKLQTDAVTNPKIADGAIHTANLADANVTFAKLHTALVVTESDAISSNDNDTTVPTSAAVIDYVATQIATKDNSDEITEGSTNLYFTNERVDDRVNSLLTAGTGITLTYDDTANTLTVAGAAQYGDSDVSAHLNTSTASSGEYLSWNGSDFDWATIPAGYTDSDVASYLSTNGYGTSSSIIASITDSAPTTLDTLNELAAALGDDANFSTTVTNSIGTKWTQDNTKISNWDTAYSWGNHASAGYLTSYTETDTLNSVTGRGATTTNAVGTGKITVTTSQQNGLELDGSHSNGSYLYINGPVGNTWFGQNGSGLASIWSDGSTQALTLAASTGNATFSGSVTATGATFTGDIIANGLEVGTAYGSDSQYLGIKRSAASSNDYILIQGSSSDAGSTYLTAGSGKNVHIRASSNNTTNQLVVTTSGTTIGGNTVWHAGNDGSGSGLDADTLDGVQGANFLRSDTDDTFTGNLTVASGSLFLPAGYNLQWGAGYNSGKSTIWSDGTANIIRMAPTGNSSGKTLELTATATNTFRSLLIDSNWGAGTYSEALTVYGTYPSYAFRSTTSSTTFLQHLDSAGHLTWYFDTTGNTGTSWNMKAKLTSAGVLTIGSSGSDTVWSSGNDGSGSGLDADTVDGIQASNFLRSDTSDTMSGTLTITNPTYGGISIGESATNYDGWNTQLNVHGSSHSRVHVKTSNVRMGIYAHDSWHGGAMGHVGTYTNHQLSFICNATQRAVLTTAGSLSTDVQGTLWGASNDGSGSGLDADTVDGIQGGSFLRSDASDTSTGLIEFQRGLGIHREDGVYVTPTSKTYSVYWKFAESSQLNSPPGSGTWRHVATIQGWSQHSSNYPSWQMSFGNGAFGVRQSTSNSAWASWQTVWTSGNDGSGSGLDADTLDGYQGSNYIGLNGNSYFQLTTWLQSTSTHGFYSPSSGAGTHFYPGDLGDYGSFRTTGRKGGWGGYSIEGRVVFMHNGSNESGIYNDVNNHWLFYAINGGKAAMYDNGSEKIYTYASGGRVTGNLLATSDVYAYYSDERLKDKTGKVENAIEKVKEIETFYYTHNEKAIELGYKGTEQQIGVSAQSVEKVLPEVVHLAPIDDDGEGNSVSGEEYKTVNYGRLVPLLIQAIKEQQAQIEELKEKLK
jgi:hypothetical protein